MGLLGLLFLHKCFNLFPRPFIAYILWNHRFEELVELLLVVRLKLDSGFRLICSEHRRWRVCLWLNRVILSRSLALLLPSK